MATPRKNLRLNSFLASLPCFPMATRGNTVYGQANFQTLMFIVLNADGPPSMESNLGALKGGSVLRGFSKDYSKPVPELKKER